MRRYRVMVLSLLLPILLAALSFPATAFAAGATMAISISPQSPQVGDVFTIKLTISSSSAIGSLEAGLTYDSSRMEYVSGGGNAVELSSGTGGIVGNGGPDTKTLSYSLRFRATKAGQASFAVTSTEINDYDSGKNLGDLKKSVSISISAKSTATPIVTPNPNSDEPIPVSVDGQTMYVMRDLQDEVVPDGFHAEMISYHGVDVQAARHPFGIVLLRVTDAGGNAAFYVYNAGTDSLYPYVAIQAGDMEYDLLPVDDVSAQGYAPSTITIGGQMIRVLSPVSNTGFYLVRAINAGGTSGYYFYDATEGTLQRAWVNAVPSASEPLAQTAAKSDNWPLLIALIFVCIVLIAFVGIRFHRYRRHDHESA